MKKVICLFLIIIALIPILTYALENETVNITVGKVENGNSIVDVEITWDSLSFTYIVENNYRWDNTTHKYVKEDVKSYWNNNSCMIKVKNNSHKTITVSAIYKGAIDTINGSFSNSSLKLEAGSTKNITFNIAGTLTSDYSKTTSAGTITLGF